MALIVEDGTGLANADSYVDVTDVDAYATALNITSWTTSIATMPEKESACRVGTQYIDNGYMFPEMRLQYLTQALEWPRSGYYWNSYEVRQLKKATCEAAIRALSGAIITDVDPQYSTKVVVGPIEKSLSNMSGSQQKHFTIISALLKDFTLGGFGTNKISVLRA